MVRTARQQGLIEHVNRVGVASIDQLSAQFGVSGMTIRRDIAHLARGGLLVQVPGGAQRMDPAAKFHEDHLRSRLRTNVAVKQRLAEKAASLIEPGDTLFLDGSTTIICLARVLAQADRQITVVTNSTLVELELAEARNVRLIGLGGVFDRETFTFCPVDESESVLGYHVKKAFLSCTGVVIPEGTFENSVFNLAIKRKVARSAEMICLLADGSKLGRRALNRVLDIGDINVLITEAPVRPDWAEALAAKDIQVYAVEA